MKDRPQPTAHDADEGEPDEPARPRSARIRRLRLRAYSETGRWMSDRGAVVMPGAVPSSAAGMGEYPM